MDQSCSEIIAKWASALQPDEIPASALTAAEHTVIDTVALAVAALETDYGQAVRKAFGSQGSCTVWGTDAGTDAFGAAVINGTCAHGEDYDNTFEGCPVHSGVVIVPAVFAAAELMEFSNDDVVKGLVVGIEIANRLGIVAGKGVHSAGFHPTAILGTMAAAVGTAAAAGLRPKQIRDALGVAGSMAAGIIEYLADGSWTKRMHAGWAAQSGLRAAMMGGAGFSGPRTVIEGTHGLYSSFAPSIAPDYAPLCDDLGTEWQCARVAFKPYACGTMTQPFIDCAARLKARGVEPAQVKRITCEAAEGTLHRLWEPLALKQSPPTPYAAKFSSPYTVACGLVHGGAGLAQFTDEALKDTAVSELASKVFFKVDPENEYPKNYTGHVKVELADGSVLEERQGQLRGGVRDPLTREDILSKAQANLEFAGRSQSAAEVLEEFAQTLFNRSGNFSSGALRNLSN